MKHLILTRDLDNSRQGNYEMSTFDLEVVWKSAIGSKYAIVDKIKQTKSSAPQYIPLNLQMSSNLVKLLEHISYNIGYWIG